MGLRQDLAKVEAAGAEVLVLLGVAGVNRWSTRRAIETGS